MKIIDISWPISEEMTAYKNKKTVVLTPLKHFEVDHVRETLITMGSHTGTHVDAPAHFVEKGKVMTEVPLSSLIGKAVVLDLVSSTQVITVEDIMCKKDLIQQHDIVLLKANVGNGGEKSPFDAQFSYLSSEAAKVLIAMNIKAVGIDYLGIERDQKNHPTHHLFFKNEIPIIEGLRLGHVQEGRYTCVCLPLFIEGIEAAPARAILWKE
ncbi:MAG: cyclase family protein [Candidatus Babeliales bacterium]